MNDLPALIRKMIEHLDGNQHVLAGRLGGSVSQPDVSRWLKGAVPKGQNFQRILVLARELGINTALGDLSSEDVAASLDKPPLPTVKIKGYVGAGSAAHFYAVADDAFEEAPAPNGASDRTIALQIRGKSWGPAMDSWLVFYDDVRSPVTSDLLGEACVVGLSDDRILLKVIRSNGRGGYDLHPNSTTDDVIRDAQIEWAAKVIGMRPR